jgi:16S rRNA (cytosine967-C5)-methyltransferase
MKFDNQLRYASVIITAYKGGVPLHAWLKDFFRENKQMGSHDRKLVSNLVYCFYRLGHSLKDIPLQERILTGLFLCRDEPSDLLGYFKPDWNENANRPAEEKIAFCRHSGLPFETGDIFPWKDELSEGIDHRAFCLSFLRQPDLFLRIRPGYEKEVLLKLEQQSSQPPARSLIQQAQQTTRPPAPYEFIPPFTLRLPNGFKTEELFTPDKEVVIQDYSSQRIAPFLELPSGTLRPGDSLSFWDACAASGGKSILAYDLHPGIDITVSDIRESILQNLRHRFRQAGIEKYHSFIADLTCSGPPESQGRPPLSYRFILADAPCTGSGTWSRTPEELYFFHPRKILRYSEMQRKILSHIIPSLSKGASLVYSTCSVFKKENEEIAALVRDSFGLRPDRTENIAGYAQKADSLFAARFVA